MALATISYQSRLLHRPVPLTMLLPDGQSPRGVLYLLHGYSDGHQAFVRNSALERFCADQPLVVVMPSAENGFYTDSACGPAHWSYLTRELPRVLGQWLHLEGCRQFVGGISMGGYGAAKWALTGPERFQEVFLISPVADIASVAEQGFNTALDPNAPSKDELYLDHIFGGRSPRDTENDLFYLLDRAQTEQLPAFSVYTGTEDFMYTEILALTEALQHKGACCQLHTSPGLHLWTTWEPFLEHMIERIAPQLP